MSLTMICPQTPTIEIHLADDDDLDNTLEIQPLKSPYSPKFPSPMAHADSDADDFRPIHLLPPPTVSPIARPKLSTLPTDKKGIDDERFAQLLRNSRERAALKHGRKEGVELRKQVTINLHTTKALQRRALFLSRIQTPPSPGAADSPVTPPESPSIFHFSLPSPGLQSPLAMFETIAAQEQGLLRPNSVTFPGAERECPARRKPWVEEVDFKARVRRDSIRGGTPAPELDLAVPQPSAKHARRASANGLPSLDQITARLTKSGHLPVTSSEVAPSVSAVGGLKVSAECPPIGRPRLALPARHRRTPSSPLATSSIEAPQKSTNDLDLAPRPPSNRLPAFLQRRASPEPAQVPLTPTIVIEPPAPAPIAAPKPTSGAHTLPSGSIVLSSPPSSRRRPTNPTPPPLPPSQPFTPRAVPTRLPISGTYPANAETRKQRGLDMVEKLKRRSSAPAALPPVPATQHRVLALKGGF